MSMSMSVSWMGRIKVQCRLPTAQCRCTRCPRGGLVRWGEVSRYMVQRSRSIWLRLRFGPGWRSTPSTSYPCFRTSMYICYATRIHKVKVPSFLTRFNQQIWSAISHSFLYCFLFVSRPLYATPYISQMSNSITRFDNLTELFLQSQKWPLTLRR